MSHSITIETDVDCMRCSYNLRGLSMPGCCPECGTDLSASIHEWRLRRFKTPLSVAMSDPKWVRQLIEGSVLAIASVFITAFYVLLPDSMFFFRSQGRVSALWLCVSSWTLSGVAAWKLAASQPYPNGARKPSKSELLRIGVLLYGLLPMWWVLCEYRPWHAAQSIFVSGAVLSSLGGLVGSCGFYYRVNWIARRLPSRLLRVESITIAMVWPILFILCLISQPLREPSSLETISSLPGVHVLAPEAARVLTHQEISVILHQRPWTISEMIILLILGCCAIGALSIFHLLYLLVRARFEQTSRVRVEI